MNRKTLGTTGFDIAPIVFGGNVLGWTTDEAESFRVLDAFVDHGFDTIDTADVYSAWVEGNSGGESETMLGKWFAARPGMRDKVKVFTKVGSDMGGPGEKGLSEAWILKAVEKSLTRMGTDAIDLYFSHWPDASVTHAETLGAYDKLLKAGKIRAIGASNYDAALLKAALETSAAEGLPAYQVIQPEYNLYDRAAFDGELRDICMRNNIGVVTYFSLASGFLSGKYRSAADLEGRKRADMVEKYLTERGMRLLDVLEDVAAAHKAAPAEVALAWLIGREGVTAPIASATSVAQVESFARAAALKLSAEDMARLTDA
ncbi:aldo/keto reductase [Pseudooceanicola sp. CBS1P-1]|uniref:Aldo/keto reductase n=1 Tax=Pseudooceanicola albus TaxID=2692189 RepID=A0A6L7G5C8_9RHOB|nr:MULTISPECIES: aldo/keto reductase [Pseudooceanicola]MBT9386842.1 aldo/keto reductase [Pseudooceanicola endophyticus]MXN19335.1 aldo/keto reductase [Pseudooceanicola albus]